MIVKIDKSYIIDNNNNKASQQCKESKDAKIEKITEYFNLRQYYDYFDEDVFDEDVDKRPFEKLKDLIHGGNKIKW